MGFGEAEYTHPQEMSIFVARLNDERSEGR